MFIYNLWFDNIKTKSLDYSNPFTLIGDYDLN